MVLIFDYDGTLHNTKHIYGCAFRKAYDMLVKEGYAEERLYTDEDVSKYLGVSAQDMWKDFMPELADDVWHRASMIIGRELIEGVLGGKAQLFDGVEDTLKELKAKGYTMVILSNCRHDYMDAHKKALGLDRWFDSYFCAEDYDFIPKENIFPFIKEKYPDESFVMTGDRASDFRVGKVNGLKTIGCAYGFGTEEERKLCDVIINSPQEITDILKAL